MWRKWKRREGGRRKGEVRKIRREGRVRQGEGERVKIDSEKFTSSLSLIQQVFTFV